MSGNRDQPFGGNLEGIPQWADSLSSPLGKGVGAAMSAPLLRLYFPNPHRNEPHQVAQAMAIDAGLAGLGAGGAAAVSRNMVDPLIKDQNPMLRAGVHALAALGGGAGGVMLSRYLQDGVVSAKGLVEQQNTYYSQKAKREHEALLAQIKEERRRKRLEQQLQLKMGGYWREVPDLVKAYAPDTLKTAAEIRPGLRATKVSYVAHYCPEYDVLRISAPESNHKSLEKWAKDYGKCGVFVSDQLPNPDELWVKVAVNVEPPVEMKTEAPPPPQPNKPWGPTVGEARDAFHSTFIKPQYAFNGPNPMTATVLGGLISAGLGYGAGTLGKWLIPRRYREYINADNLPYLGALAGAGIGATPGLVWGTSSPKGWMSRYPWPEVGEEPTPEQATQDEPKLAALFDRTINVPALQRSLLADAYNPLPNQQTITFPSYASGASGVLEAASVASNSSYVSPWDVAKTVIGMAPSAASGMLGGAIAGATLGRTLGMLGALTPEGEQKVREAGIWAGIINTMVPKAFGVS